MGKKTSRFIVLLLLTLLVGFVLHNFILVKLHFPIYGDYIVLSYGVNFIMAIAILFFVERAIKKKSTHSGMFFILGSALKYVVFFFLFYPLFIEDNTMSRTEFASFFVPYALCLIMEVTYLSKQLNNQTF